jgi:hypothetical protein
MCGAIPVVGPRANGMPLNQEVGYTYCIASESRKSHEDDCDLYRNETARTLAAQTNWLHFVQRHSFIEQQELADLLLHDSSIPIVRIDDDHDLQASVAFD